MPLGIEIHFCGHQFGTGPLSHHRSCSFVARWLGGASLGAALLLGGCTESGDPRLEPSGAGLPFDADRYDDFADYIVQTRARLEVDKIYLDPADAVRELEAATPFEMHPAEGCAGDAPEKGVLPDPWPFRHAVCDARSR